MVVSRLQKVNRLWFYPSYTNLHQHVGRSLRQLVLVAAHVSLSGHHIHLNMGIEPGVLVIGRVLLIAALGCRGGSDKEDRRRFLATSLGQHILNTWKMSLGGNLFEEALVSLKRI